MPICHIEQEARSDHGNLGIGRQALLLRAADWIADTEHKTTRAEGLDHFIIGSVQEVRGVP